MSSAMKSHLITLQTCQICFRIQTQIKCIWFAIWYSSFSQIHHINLWDAADTQNELQRNKNIQLQIACESLHWHQALLDSWLSRGLVWLQSEGLDWHGGAQPEQLSALNAASLCFPCKANQLKKYSLIALQRALSSVLLITYSRYVFKDFFLHYFISFNNIRALLFFKSISLGKHFIFLMNGKHTVWTLQLLPRSWRMLVL